MQYLMGSTIGLLAVLTVGSASLPGANPAPRGANDLTSLIKERSGLTLRLDEVGWEWKDADVKGDTQQGEITFSDKKWLMYLVHWGPVQVPRITPEYVKKRMLDMWGVKFEFNGKEGRTTVAGHEAVWVEAFGTNHGFYTRFIVWNCPQSKRELIADTNYNIALKTPDADFGDEARSAGTVRCHEGEPSVSSEELGAVWNVAGRGISFQYPERWFFFDSPFYVPFPEYDGVRDRRHGSVLGLCSDQNIRIALKWEPSTASKAGVAFMVDPAVLDHLKTVVTGQPDIAAVQTCGFETFAVSGKKVRRTWGTCDFREPEDPREKSFYTGKGIFQVAQWEPDGSGRTVSIALITRQYRYEGATSTPSRSFQDVLMRQLLERIQ